MSDHLSVATPEPGIASNWLVWLTNVVPEYGCSIIKMAIENAADEEIEHG